MSLSSRKMANVEYKRTKREVISKDERQRQKESLKVYTIKEGESIGKHSKGNMG